MTTRAERAKTRRAWQRYREGKGPRPPSRPPHPAELKRREARQAREAARDPVERADERREDARLRTEHAKLVDMLREERARNAFLKEVHAHKTPTAFRTERRSGLREMVAVAMGSDWHVEETIPAVKAQYRNEYNLAIADASIQRFFQAQIDLVEHHRASKRVVIRQMVCAFSGDLMSGYIHEELLESNALSPIMTALWLKPRIEAGIRLLLDKGKMERVLVPWSYGNHGRTTPKKRIATGAENSYEYMLGRILEDTFKDDPRVVFDTSPTPHQYAQVFDYTLHFHHGDSIGYGGGVGGVGIPLLKAVPAWNVVRPAHWHCIGHFHQLRDYGPAMINGSLIGYGPYSMEIKAPFEEPQQLFFLVDSKRGKCHTTPLWVRGRYKP